jgi:CRP-like cAMP-binding protein
MNRSTARACFASIAAFASLEADVIAAMEKVAIVYRLKAGEYLYNQGDAALAFYVVQEGGIRLVEHTADGQDVQLTVFAAGELFGLLAISGAFAHPSAAQSIAQSVVAGIPGIYARRLMLACPQISLRIVDLLVEHVHHSHGRIRQLSAERADRRLARALLYYVRKFGVDCGTHISISVALTQRDLSEYVATTPETANRLLRGWEQQGYIRSARQHIDVLDLGALAQLAEEPSYMGVML